MENNRIKILVVCCGGLNNGGSQNVLMSIVRNLSDKYIFDAICTNEDSYYKQEFESYGGQVFYVQENKSIFGKRIGNYINKYTRIYNAALKIMKNNGPYRAVHCHNYCDAAPYLHAAKKSGISIRVSHSHSVATSFSKRSRLYYFYIEMYRRKLLKYATHKIGCSKAACEFLFGKDSNFTIVNNAIDLKRFDMNAYSDVSFDDCIRFVNVGRYSPNKNQQFALEFFREFLKLNHNATMTLVGSGPYENIFINKAIEYGFDDKLQMLPHDSNIPQVLSNSDFFIFPSMYEGLGIVLIEAQAMGLHCFASDVIPREADLGGCTFLSLDDGAKKWAGEVDRYIRNYGKAKKQYDISSYDILNVVPKYDDIYNS